MIYKTEARGVMRKFIVCDKAKSVVLKDVIESAKKTMNNSYSPYSKCKVGCALVSAKTGCIYSGCNVENASYGATICAERNAITTAITSEGDIGIVLMVVVNNSANLFPPCGICLQFMSEFVNDDTQIVLLANDEKEPVFYNFSDLMPVSFKL